MGALERKYDNTGLARDWRISQSFSDKSGIVLGSETTKVLAYSKSGVMIV